MKPLLVIAVWTALSLANYLENPRNADNILLFRRADQGSSRRGGSSPGPSRPPASGGSSPPQQGHAAAAGSPRSSLGRTWSQTSDSSGGSMSDTSNPGGSTKTKVEVSRGEARVTHKKPGEEAQRYIGREGMTKTFTNEGKSRTKVRGVTDDTEASMRLHDGKTSVKVDNRRGGTSGWVGPTRGEHVYGSEVPAGRKDKYGPEDTNEHVQALGEIQGKGKIRGKAVPKDPGSLKVVKPWDPRDGIMIGPSSDGGQSGYPWQLKPSVSFGHFPPGFGGPVE